jgi:Right handed beta helix region
VFHNTTGGGGIGRTTIRGVEFSDCGYSIYFQASANGLTIANNVFTNYGIAAITARQTSNVIISGNQFQSDEGACLDLTDGEMGGPFTLDLNHFSRSCLISLHETHRGEFLFGNLNVGVKLAGVSAATSETLSATGCVTFAVPHGLVGQPDPDKTTATPRVVSGKMKRVSVSVISVDEKNVNVEACATVLVPGQIRVVEQSSM